MQKTNSHQICRLHGLIAGLFVFCLLCLNACVQRERSNILDPQNDQTEINLNLRLSSDDDIIRLSWTRPAKLEFNRYILYRRSGAETDFTPVDSVLPQATHYQDTVPQSDIYYEYRISVLGPETESAPSKSLGITPGPGNLWVLDYAGFQIFRLTYDLQYTTINRGTLWRPWRMALSADNDLALITYPGLRFFELLDTSTGRTKLESEEIEAPYDVIYSETDARFWVSDSTGSLVGVDPLDGQVSQITGQLNRPTQLVKGPFGQIGLLDAGDESVILISSAGAVIRKIRSAGHLTLVKPEYFSFGAESNSLFIIHHPDSLDALIYFNTATDSAQEIARAENFGTLRPDLAEPGKIWIVEQRAQGSVLVQLSGDGQRLSELSGYDYITDFLINPENFNFVITDAGASEIIHMRRDLSIVGRSQRAFQPVRVYLE